MSDTTTTYHHHDEYIHVQVVKDDRVIRHECIAMANDAMGEDKKTVAKQITSALNWQPVLIDALKRLLDCPDLNTDELEPETTKAIRQALDAEELTCRKQTQ